MVPNREISDQFFDVMNEDGGTLSASEIMTAVRRIMDIYCPPIIHCVNQSATVNTQLDLDE
jgi:hypothetical protein